MTNFAGYFDANVREIFSFGNLPARRQPVSGRWAGYSFLMSNGNNYKKNGLFLEIYLQKKRSDQKNTAPKEMENI